MPWHPAAICTDMPANPNIAATGCHRGPVTSDPMSTVPVPRLPVVATTGALPNKTRNPIARVSAIARLVDRLFFNNYLFFGLPLPLNVLTIGIGPILPLKPFALFRPPKTEVPHPVLTTVTRFPIVSLGGRFSRNEIVVDPFSIFVPTCVLPEKTVFGLLAPKAFNDLAVWTHNTLLPDIVITGSFRIRAFQLCVFMVMMRLCQNRGGGENSQHSSG